MVAVKGYLSALALDHQLQQTTAGQVDLGLVLHDLVHDYNYDASGKAYTRQNLLKEMSTLTGQDWSGVIAQMVDQPGAVDLKAVSALADLTVGETRRVVSADGLPLYYQWIDGPAERAAIVLSDGPGAYPL